MFGKKLFLRRSRGFELQEKFLVDCPLVDSAARIPPTKRAHLLLKVIEGRLPMILS
jgi:hypothetical protein